MPLLNCRQVSEIVCESCDGRLRFSQRVRIWLHGRICKCPMCNGFYQHLVVLRETVGEAFVDIDSRYADVRLDSESRQRIDSALKAAMTSAKRDDPGSQQSVEP